jgi:large subunit ribosomal protein L19
MTSIPIIEAALKAANDKKFDFQIGDTVRVHVKIEEGEKSRTQIFEGTVIAMHRGSIRSSFTVRKVSYGVGVERMFPLFSPSVEKVEVKSSHRARRAKLYYLRGRSGKSARLVEIRE